MACVTPPSSVSAAKEPRITASCKNPTPGVTHVVPAVLPELEAAGAVGHTRRTPKMGCGSSRTRGPGGPSRAGSSRAPRRGRPARAAALSCCSGHGVLAGRRGGSGADRLVAAGQSANALRDCLAGLSAQHREVFQLRQLEDLSADEVSGLLGCTINHVGVMFHRARVRLRACLEAKGWGRPR